MNKLTETSPERIWLQISDDKDDLNYPYPSRHDDVTWCIDSVVAAEVAYVRADLLEVELKRVAACKNFIAGLEQSSTWMRGRINELDAQLKLSSAEEVCKQRDANETLTNELEAANARIAELESELETERMRLAACGVVALSNTHESASRAREMTPEYFSASLQDVTNAVDREMALRDLTSELEAELAPYRNHKNWTRPFDMDGKLMDEHALYLPRLKS